MHSSIYGYEPSDQQNNAFWRFRSLQIIWKVFIFHYIFYYSATSQSQTARNLHTCLIIYDSEAYIYFRRNNSMLRLSFSSKFIFISLSFFYAALFLHSIPMNTYSFFNLVVYFAVLFHFSYQIVALLKFFYFLDIPCFEICAKYTVSFSMFIHS